MNAFTNGTRAIVNTVEQAQTRALKAIPYPSRLAQKGAWAVTIETAARLQAKMERIERHALKTLIKMMAETYPGRKQRNE